LALPKWEVDFCLKQKDGGIGLYYLKLLAIVRHIIFPKYSALKKYEQVFNIKRRKHKKEISQFPLKQSPSLRFREDCPLHSYWLRHNQGAFIIFSSVNLF